MIKGTVMMHPAVRRRRSAFVAGLATMAMTLGFAAIPAGAAPPPDVDYVSLGDSYTAGTGAGPFSPPPPPLPCLQTHPGGYADIVGRTSPTHLVANAACHGALLRGGDVPSVEQQIRTEKLLSLDTELVSITAGANDVGVSAVLFACASPSEAACAAEVKTAVGRFPALRAGLTQAYAAIHRLAPNAKIAVLGYPRLFDPVGGAPVIPLKNQILVNQATALLNATIATAAVTANIFYRANSQYIDVTARFAGHAANSGPKQWIVLDPPTAQGFTPQTFHPNPTGHEQYAEALTAAVNLPALARP
jgi:lysophospholipase L1-like esterase